MHSPTLLLLTSSLSGSEGVSSQLVQQYASEWLHRHPQGRVLRRDLHAMALPHLGAAELAALRLSAAARTPAQAEFVATADALIEELETADMIVLGVPMYNFAVPSTLKVWMDYVARAGRTFRYTEQGPEGLLKGKQVVVFLTRGGHYQDTAADQQTPFLRQFLGFVGLTDVQFVHAEGLALGAQSRDAALLQARTQAQHLARHAQAA